MATEDNAITLNPFTTLTEKEKQAVIVNESVRLFLRSKKINPKFRVEPHQAQVFKDFQKRGIPGETKDSDIRATILGRIISGDQSAGPYTEDQMRAAEQIRSRMYK